MIAFVRGVDPALDVLGIEVQRHRVDVGEDRRRAGARDRLGGRVEGERRADHLVAAPDADRLEHEHERVGAVRDADRLRDAEVRRRPPPRTPARSGPKMNRPDSSDAPNASWSSGISGAYCALTSTRSIFTAGRVYRGSAAGLPRLRRYFQANHAAPPASSAIDRRSRRSGRRGGSPPTGCRAPSRRRRGRSTRSPSRAASGPCSGGAAPRRPRPGSRRTSGRPA